MESGGNNFNDFPEIVPTREITTKIEKTFLVFSSVAVGLFLKWAQCCSINSTRLPALRSAAPSIEQMRHLEVGYFRKRDNFLLFFIRVLLPTPVVWFISSQKLYFGTGEKENSGTGNPANPDSSGI